MHSEVHRGANLAQDGEDNTNVHHNTSEGAKKEDIYDRDSNGNGSQDSDQFQVGNQLMEIAFDGLAIEESRVVITAINRGRNSCNQQAN